MTASMEAYAVALEAEHRKRVALKSRVHVEYQHRPIDWIVDKLGVPRHTLVWSLNKGYDAHAWDGTKEPLEAIADALADWKSVGVEAGTGTNKSFTAACLILWFLACWKDSRVFTFAPQEEQLRLYIWTEVKKLWPKFQAFFPGAVLSDLRLRMKGGTDDSWGAVGRTARIRAGEEVSTNAAGMHARDMLIITEETPGIDRSIMGAIENTCTAPHNLKLALGNPDNTADTLHTFCKTPGITHVRISALDHPNVVTGDHNIIPGAASRKSVSERLEKYGVTGRLFLSRVRGVCPSESADALIARRWCTASAGNDLRRREILQAGRSAGFIRAMGVDVANSEHGDEGAIARGIGPLLLEVVSKPCPNANQLGRDVLIQMRADGVLPENIGIDSVGVGAGTVNVCRDEGFWIKALNGGMTPESGPDPLATEKFLNCRSQQHWQLRLDLESGEVVLPDDPELFDDLCTPQWTTRNGKIVVESKEDIKTRLGRSPNKGDAVIYWNWVRHRPDNAPKPKFSNETSEGDVEALAAWERESEKMEPWDEQRFRADDDYGHIIGGD